MNKESWTTMDNVEGLSDDALLQLISGWITIDEKVWLDYLDIESKLGRSIETPCVSDLDTKIFIPMIRQGLMSIPFVTPPAYDELTPKDRKILKERFYEAPL